MNRRRFSPFFLFLILLIFLFIAACGPTKGTVYTSNEEFWEGTEALDFAFVEENPPELVYEDTPFSIALDIANKGAHTLVGFLTVSLEEDYTCLLDEENECTEEGKTQWFSLEGKSIFNPVGGSDVLEYKAKAKSVGRLSEKHDVQVLATACYEYTTVWNQEVCIDTDINKMNIFPGACEATDISLTDQGAPLAITQIESHMIPTGTGYLRQMFTIYVANNGNGQVINKEKTEDACTATGLSSRDYNMVFLKQFILSSEELLYDFNGYDYSTGKEINAGEDGDTITCQPNPLILEGNGEDYITCIVNEEEAESEMFSLDQAPYTTTISMQFDYGYTLSNSREVTIKKILTS